MVTTWRRVTGYGTPLSGGHRQCGLWKTAVSLPGCLFVVDVFLFHYRERETDRNRDRPQQKTQRQAEFCREING